LPFKCNLQRYNAAFARHVSVNLVGLYKTNPV
jgi:hypothetical protein